MEPRGYAYEGLGPETDFLMAYAVRKELPFLAGDIGLNYQYALTRQEIADLVSNTDTSAIGSDHIRNFRRAGYVAATDDEGSITYIVVIGAATAGIEHVARAVQNAKLLTLFTGMPCRPVVAAIRIVDEIAKAIADGEVFWCQLEEPH